MSSMYELTASYQQLLAKEDLTDDDLALLASTQESIEDKGVQYAYLIKELQAKQAATDEVIKSAQAKKKRLASSIERLENYLLNAMIHNAIEVIDKSPYFDIKIRHNPVSVEEYESEAIPPEYWAHKDVVTLDKNKVKEDIENLGLVIPGVRLVRKFSLQIK